ncbi:MAG: protein kinase [Archangium sp.]|nr:protein kinase [Archangium sp.]
MNCEKCGGNHPSSSCPQAWLGGDLPFPALDLPPPPTSDAHTPTHIPMPPQPLAPMFTTPAPTVDPLLGMTVGSYRILKLLGTGGMGSVYLGEHTGIGSKVAIKFLHEHLANNADLVQRFYAEARSVNVIGHANIVSIFDMNVLPPSRYYLVMEYLDGKSLEMLVQQGPMPMSRAVPILVQVCDALDQAHEAKVVHRDLKPENLILVKRGRQEDFVKVLDFGIAKLQSTMASRKTATGVIIGTPDYMAPEQAQGENVDSRTDQYSLGVIAYELATGKTPFAGLPITSMLVAHLSQDPRPPHEVNPSVSPAISQVILKALAKKPEARFRTCGDFAIALEEALKASSTSSVPVFVPSPSSIPLTESAAARVTPAQLPDVPSPSKVTPMGPPGPVAPPVSQSQQGKAPTPVGARGFERTPAQAVAAIPRHVARFDVKVKPEGGADQTYTCQDVSRAGCFIICETALPRVFSRVTVTIPDVGSMLGDVVRHVTKEQAEAWNMPAGFGVQFVAPRPEQREALDNITRGLPITPLAPQTPTSQADDPLAEKLLTDVRKRIQGDHYVVLGLPLDVDFPQVKARGRELSSQLMELGKRPISAGQRKQLEAAQDRLKVAVDVLGVPSKRVEFDGMRFNWKGVGACLSGGLRVTELEEVRKRFLKANEGTEARSALHVLTANGHERDGAVADALRVVEHALSIDPLNLELHHRRKALLRKTPLKK